MVMLARGTTAPEESFPTPRMVPVFCCAVAARAAISTRVAAAASSPASAPERFPVLLFIIPPFFCTHPWRLGVHALAPYISGQGGVWRRVGPAVRAPPIR